MGGCKTNFHRKNIKTLQPHAKNQIIVRAQCKNIPVNLLVDTGAGISLVNAKFIKHFNLIKFVRPTNIMIAGLDKNIVPVEGEITLPISLGNCLVEHTFVLCDRVDNEFLIGMDILSKIQAKIDLPNKRIQTPNGEVEFYNKPVSIDRRVKIRCTKTVTLPANTSGYLLGKIAVRNAKQNYEGIVDPFRKLSAENGVFITGSMSYTEKNIVPIHYVNVMPHEVKIYRNQLVGFLDPIHMNGVHSINKVDSHLPKYHGPQGIPRLPDAKPVDHMVSEGKWSNPSELHSQLGIDKLEIPELYREKLKNLITEYSHCFSRDRFDLGEASFYKAKIHLKNDFTPKWIPSRPVSYKLEPRMDEEINNMIKADLITRCPFSLWNSMVFLVKKPNSNGDSNQSQYRFVQDGRALSSQSIQDCYELPKINSLFDRISNCEWISTFDFQSSFNQIGQELSSQPLTAFTYKGNRYMWKRLVMGQISSSAQFSRCINLLFSGIEGPLNLALYVDDMMLWSKDLESHLVQLRFIFERLTWGCLKLNPRKTRFLKKEARWLGHVVCKDGIKLDENRCQAIQKLQAPTTTKEVQKFLGIMNYNRSYIKSFAQIAAPLYDLLKKGVRFEWNKAHQESFMALKAALQSSPILAVPDLQDRNQSYIVTVDSSKRGQGATLSQIINGRRRLIGYWSRAVPKHQQKLGATRFELLALHGALTHWKLLLLGTKFVCLTDCRAILSLTKIFKNENSYFQRRLADLSQYNFELQHRAGSSTDMKMADFLSRYSYKASYKDSATQTESDNVSKIHDILRLSETERSKPVSTAEIKSEYSKDSVLSKVIDWVKAGNKPTQFNHRSEPPELSHYWKDFDLLHFKKGILYRKWRDPILDEDRDLIIVPCTLVERILYSFHDTIATSHAGIEACIDRCTQKFYFYKLKSEFELYIKCCLKCARTKQPKAYLRAPMKPVVYSDFGQSISIDHLEGSKTPTASGNVALLTICDAFTNYLVCVPVKSTDTETSIKVILEHWILKFGVPETVTHDLGSGFTSGLWKAVMKAFDIKDARTTPKFSQSNGKAEACNKKLNQCLRVTLTPDQWKNYDIYVKYLVFCLNSLRNSRTGMSPNFLVFGRELRMPRDLFIDDDDRLKTTLLNDEELNDRVKQQAYDLYKRIASITRKARDATEKRVEYMTKQFDKKTQGPYFMKGDLCLLLVLWPKHKYAERWSGPYKVTDVISNHLYVVDVNGELKVVNISKMKHFKESKFSNLESEVESTHNSGVIESSNVSQNPLSGKRRVRQRVPSSSSEDDNVLISLHKPRLKRRSPRLAHKQSDALPSQETVEASNTEQTSRGDTSQPESIVPDEIVVIPDDSSENNTTLTDLNKSGVSEVSEQGFQTADETMNDSNVSENQDVDETVPGSSRVVALSDSEPEGEEPKSSRGSNTRYSLRKKPAKPDRYGCPVTLMTPKEAAELKPNQPRFKIQIKKKKHKRSDAQN